MPTVVTLTGITHFVFLYFTGNMLTDAKAHSKFLPCGPLTKMCDCLDADAIWLIPVVAGANLQTWTGQMQMPKCQHRHISGRA